MSVYVCSICGYEYDEADGLPSQGIKAGTKWEDVPDSFTCPLCGSPKSLFVKKDEPEKKKEIKTEKAKEEKTEDKDNPLVLSALFLNLAKGAEKEARAEESSLFAELGEYYASKAVKSEKDLDFIVNTLNKSAKEELPQGKALAKEKADRGALRALTWAEKVTLIVNGLIDSFKKQGKDLLKGKNIYVCEICGFIYIGDKKPDICPVCKVPALKFHQVNEGGII